MVAERSVFFDESLNIHRTGHVCVDEKAQAGNPRSPGCHHGVTLGSISTSDFQTKHGSVPKAVPGITVVPLYDEAQVLPLPQMYGKIHTTPLIPHRFKLADIEEAYRIFENKLDGVINVAIEL